MPRRIDIDIMNPVSLADAVVQIDAFLQDIPNIERRIVRRLAQLGLNEARVNFTGAVYAGDNDADVSVRILEDGRSAELVASGQSVLFIEFGTGIANPEAPAEAVNAATPPPVPHGEFGHHRARSRRGWLYRGSPGNAPDTEPSTLVPGLIHTYGNEANTAMWRARETLIRELPRIFREEMSDYDR